ncbi:MAG: 16S rRNA (guanine(966)-N(2))-methyltransferase RsmD [Rhizobiales bacterium 62-17]|nr:16S rRNA (guanine(966)-N(2))-methyltransferase RsmD [Hyphomicrobiales bacterium]OJY00626.1 MAG: 16S rRNA (guanine(966)-N(2))-methyltransferase RsmD [Rhizobiales bacterium 62-17]
MRIVGGSLRGRALKAPSSQTVRPTSDRLREAMFNVLAHAHSDPADGARVIDLFAGTGALGLEALSRGARFALFVDDSVEGRALVRANVESLALTGISKIFRRDATRLGAMPPQEPFTLAFLDPPYGRDLAPLALASLRDGGWLAPEALLVVEESAKADLQAPEGFVLLDRRDYGDTQVAFMRFGKA